MVTDLIPLISATRLHEIEQAILERLNRAATDIWEVGNLLTEAKEGLEHGQFLDWLSVSFDMSVSTAENFMRVARTFTREFLQTNAFKASVLYRLAAPSTPGSVLLEITQNIQDAADLSLSDIEELIEIGKYVEQNATDGIKTRVAHGELSLRTAYNLIKALEAAPPKVAAVCLQWNVSDPAVVDILCQLAEKSPEEFEDVANTGYFQSGEGEPISLSDANARDAQAAFDEIRFEQNIDNAASHSPTRFLDANCQVLDVNPDGLTLTVRVDVDASHIHVGDKARLILQAIRVKAKK